MIDWALSKIVMSIAAISFIALAIVFFGNIMEENNVNDIQFKETADRIAKQVSETLSFNGELRSNFTFRSNKTNRAELLPLEINDEKYTLTFYRTSVKIDYSSSSISSQFTGKVHLFDPEMIPDIDVTSKWISDLDAGYYNQTIHSGVDFVVENQLRIVDGKYSFLTFIYPVVEI